ncbi:MAG: Hpt domain-containing protein [Candidatus Hodarchaeales archaeon]
MIDKEILEIFLEEFDSLYVNVKKTLEDITSGQETTLFEIFRSFHTWKGNAAILNFNKMYNVAKAYEDYFKPKQNDKTLSILEIEALTDCLNALKIIRKCIKETGHEGKDISVDSLITKIKNMV